MYLLALLAVSYGIIVDRAVGAPGHGKCEVDGANAVDKRFIETKCASLRLLIMRPHPDE